MKDDPSPEEIVALLVKKGIYKQVAEYLLMKFSKKAFSTTATTTADTTAGSRRSRKRIASTSRTTTR